MKTLKTRKFIFLLLILTVTTITATNNLQVKIDLFMQKSGYNKQLSQYPNLFKQGVDIGLKRSNTTNPKLKKIVTKLIQKHFTVNKIKTKLNTYLLKYMKNNEMDVVLSFYNTDFSKKVTELEIKNGGPDILSKINNFDPNSVNLNKRNEIDLIVKKLNMIESSLETQKVVIQGMIQVINAKLPKSQRLSNNIIEKIYQRQKQKMQLSIEKMIKYNLYIVYKPLSLKEIKKYRNYLSQKEVTKLYMIISKGKQEALKIAAMNYGKDLIEEMENNIIQ